MGRTFSLRQGRPSASPAASADPVVPAATTSTAAAPAVVVDRAAWLALATGSLAFVLGTINVTVTNVAFTDILASFPGASPAVTGWILTGYALSFASMMLAAGRLADRYGRLRVFRFGLAGLAISSLAAGVAPSVLLLVTARVVQGICGAMAVPASLGLVLPRFPQAKQATVVGIWASVGMIASGLAPVLAAVALTLATWRWMYLILVPIAGLGLVGAKLFMDETATVDRSRRLDILGMALGSGSVFLVVYATLRGPAAGWGSPAVVGAFVAAVVLLPVFLWRSARHPEPLFDPRLFRIRSFAVANAAVALSMVGAFTSWVLWPIFLKNVWGYSVWQVGLAFTVSPLVSGAMAIGGGRWADSRGYRSLLAAAAVVSATGQLWAIAFLGDEPRYWFAFFPITLLFGLGMGPLASLLNAAALADIESRAIATANGVHQSLRYAVGGMGTALALAVLNGQHDIWRYNVLWGILGGCQILVAPLLLLAYPRSGTRLAAGRK
ncbi:MAG: MFS transporter [Acidimicrobiia bacterium]|nr:MFS transporter [Acidimicrobiia bacterium]